MEYLKINRAAWDKRTKIHLNSTFYDVKGFEAGKTSLCEIELSELPCVKNKTLLHLQCHFGLDTLSWARNGAVVTGVDLSPEAISQAKKMSAKLGIESKFICSDVYEYEQLRKGEEFDIVFTSYGAICWLPCLKKWARTVSSCLKPGGLFYMVEFHPIYNLIVDEPYFYEANPEASVEGTYTENDSDEKSEMVTWSHPLGSVVNALINEGLVISQLNEFPFSPYDCFDGLEEKQADRYYKAHGGQNVPMVYSISAKKNT